MFFKSICLASGPYESPYLMNSTLQIQTPHWYHANFSIYPLNVLRCIDVIHPKARIPNNTRSSKRKEKKRNGNITTILITKVNLMGVDSSSGTYMTCMGHYEFKPLICHKFTKKDIRAHNKLNKNWTLAFSPSSFGVM